jgi:multidrug efflux pump subunit AcrA (membrane-fusion protein)
MKRGIIIAAVLVLVAAIAAGTWWYVNENPEWWFWAQDQFDAAVQELGLEPEPEPPGLVASGFVEAEEATVATELGGRIVALHADEGDEVDEGQVLVQLDDSLLLAQVRAAQADLALAEANLAQVKAGVSQETLNRALAQLEQARTAQEAARIAWQDAQAIADNPQELELALTAARAQLGVLDFQARQALALANAAQAGSDFADASVQILEEFEPRVEWIFVDSFTFGTLPPDIPLPPGVGDGEYRINGYKIVVEKGKISLYVRARLAVPADVMDEARYQQATTTYQAWQAWTGLAQAQVARSGLQDQIAQLSGQIANPLPLQVQADTARAQYEVATSAVGLANAQVEGLKMGATPEQIAAVEAQVEIARSALDALQVQAAKFTLQAPIAGLVLERPVHVGEVALPGAPLMTLADLDHMTLTIYVPEDQLGRVYLGQPVSVTVDAYAGRTFPGSVTYIANEAEFTPRNVQTREERVNMVFAIRVALPNPDHALKPGMPADAVLIEASHPASVGAVRPGFAPWLTWQVVSYPGTNRIGSGCGAVPTRIATGPPGALQRPVFILRETNRGI